MKPTMFTVPKKQNKIYIYNFIIQSAANSLRLFLQSKYGLRNFRNDYFICSKVAVLFPKSFSNTSTMKI